MISQWKSLDEKVRLDKICYFLMANIEKQAFAWNSLDPDFGYGLIPI